MAININDSCPLFSLPNQDGKTIDISEYVGKHILVIYFYPKDDTPGCTKEACSFQDSHQVFEELNCKIFGISSDSVASHKAFANRYHLQFDLLADTKQHVRKLFGVPGNLFGLIPGRVTYIVDKSGKIRGIYNSLTNAIGHIEEAKKMVKELSGEV